MKRPKNSLQRLHRAVAHRRAVALRSMQQRFFVHVPQNEPRAVEALRVQEGLDAEQSVPCDGALPEYVDQIFHRVNVAVEARSPVFLVAMSFDDLPPLRSAPWKSRGTYLLLLLIQGIL